MVLIAIRAWGGALLGALAVGLLLGAAAASAQPTDAYQVIVHPSNPIRQIDAESLRDIFLKRRTQWDHGETMRPVDLDRRSPTRARFTREVLDKQVLEVRIYWNQQIFSGRGVPPPEKPSGGEVLAYVLRHRGGIGYVPADVDPNGARVVQVLRSRGD